MDLYWAGLMVVPTIASAMLSERMARVRSRSVKAWVWLAVLTGPLPLAPLALYLLGSREQHA